VCLDEEGRDLVPFTPSEEADWFAATLPAVLALLVRHLPGGWTQRRGDSFGLLTRVPIATLNGVLSTSTRARAGEAAALLDTVRKAGVPYCLQLRPESDGDLAAVAAGAGMFRGDDIPAMVLQNPCNLLSVPVTGPLVLRQLNPDELGTHLAVFAAGFQLPADVLAPLVWALRFTGVRHYVGEVNGEPVVTGTGIRFEDAVGIFNVATPPRIVDEVTQRRSPPEPSWKILRRVPAVHFSSRH
jgi:hypothetical protein